MMFTKLVTIVITTTKSCPFDSYDLVKNQTYKDFEVIISRDVDRNGAPWARNQGLSSAKGEYILFLDDDIKLDPHFLEKMVSLLEKHKDKSFAYCNYNRTGIIKIPHHARPWDKQTLKKTNYISTMSLIRTKDCPRWDESLTRYQDWDLWLTMLEQGKSGVHIDEFLFTAHYDGKGISNLDKKEIIEKENIVRRKHNLCELQYTA